MNLTERWKTFREFLVDVRKEIGKVSWPAKDEVVGTTTVVIVYTVVVGVFLFIGGRGDHAGHQLVLRQFRPVSRRGLPR